MFSLASFVHMKIEQINFLKSKFMIMLKVLKQANFMKYIFRKHKRSVFYILKIKIFIHFSEKEKVIKVKK